MMCLLTYKVSLVILKRLSKTHMSATLHDTCDKYTVGWIMSQDKRLQSSVPSVHVRVPVLL